MCRLGWPTCLLASIFIAVGKFYLSSHLFFVLFLYLRRYSKVRAFGLSSSRDRQINRLLLYLLLFRM